MNSNTFRNLEFEAIRRLLGLLTGSSAGQARVEALAPATDPGAVREAQAATAEGVRLLGTLGVQPYADLPDVAASLAAAHIDGIALEPRALADVASFIEGAAEIGAVVARHEGTPRLSRLASEIEDASDVAREIRRVVLPSGEVADDASPRLAETRRSLARLRTQLHSVMDAYLHDRDAERALQDKLVTTRNDRYVLLLKAGHRGQIPGIVHGSSGSGQSLYLEPMPAVELNNDIVARADEEREEVQRLLRELTARVGERRAGLERARAILGELDFVQARARLAREMGASQPEIAEGAAAAALELRDARHPLLLANLCERLGLPPRATSEPVPVTLQVGGECRVLVISGPNTGGKTVAVKTLGLLALMAQCGLHVPAAAGSRLPVFRRIYADIGDEQSIAANLSTFSAHLAAVVEMTRDLELPALVLLDEVGSGTDPTEGGALGVAIVEHFRRAGALVVATTHHGQLKAYAQSTPGIACASFGYDPKTYAPTYRLALGTPGRSLALEMAERLGLPAAVVSDARARRDEREAQAEALLKTLEEERAAQQAEGERLAAERRALEAERGELGRAEAEIASRKRQELAAFARELRRRGEAAVAEAREAIRAAVARVESAPRATAAVETRARAEAVAAIRRAEQAVLEAPELGLAPGPDAPAAVSVGGRARIRDLGLVGEVLALHGEEAEVAVHGKRLRVGVGALEGLATGAAAGGGRRGAAGWPNPPAAVRLPQRETAPAEINLVGLTVEEALPRVDKLLDDAFLAERESVRVIHGFGAGRLRQAVAGLLEGHPHVASFRLGRSGEGGGGVTVVELKQ